MTQKKALITGIAGQDGAYLAAFLLDKGYEVHGLIRWDSDLDALERLGRFAKLNLPMDKIHIHTGDITDPHSLLTLLYHLRPDEIYNLAAISHVAESFKTPTAAMETITKGTLNMLEAIKRLMPEARFYQASSSEMFGASPAPQNEQTPMNPQSPYGAAKLHAYHLTRIYRESYGLFAANGILFNHESPLRGADFVTQKIAQAVAAIDRGDQDSLTLGNLDACRDWGHARDYVEGMWMMLQHDEPDDTVLATGKDHTVRECAETAFAAIGLTLTWQGEGMNEIGIDQNGQTRVQISQEFFRPLELHHLCGDASKAKDILGWQPRTSFQDLIKEMVDASR